MEAQHNATNLKLMYNTVLEKRSGAETHLFQSAVMYKQQAWWCRRGTTNGKPHRRTRT